MHVRFTRSEAVAAGSAGSDMNQALILRYAGEHGGITTAAAAQLIGEKDYTARRLLNALVDKGFLEKVGGRKERVYKVARWPY